MSTLFHWFRAATYCAQQPPNLSTHWYRAPEENLVLVFIYLFTGDDIFGVSVHWFLTSDTSDFRLAGRQLIVSPALRFKKESSLAWFKDELSYFLIDFIKLF